MRTRAIYQRRGRRGNAYLLVLASTTLIATMLSGTVYVQTQRVRAERINADASKARLAAESGIELIRAWIEQNANWRTVASSGRWVSNVAVGEAKVDLDVVDTVDGDLANHPYHGVLITATARVGEAEQIMSATLVAKPYPIDALQYAVQAAGQVHVTASGQIVLGSSTVSTNGSLKNEATIEGNVRAGSVATAGTIYGTTTTGVAASSMPTSSSAAVVALLGTSIPGTKFGDGTLSSTSNDFGAVNPRGVYVVRSSSDVELKNLTVNGTLVVIAPGNKVTLTRTVKITPTSADLPALIIDGDALFDDKSSVTINGLVHVTGKLSLEADATIDGAVFVGSTATTDAFVIKKDLELTYEDSLKDYAPVGYAKSVDMVLQPGSFQRGVK